MEIIIIIIFRFVTPEETQPNEQSIAASIEAVINKAREEAGDKKVESQESGSSGSDSSSSDSDSSGSK